MKSDFLDAHNRHWDDAEILFSAGRYANADHLYGISAECGLKSLMVKFGMEVNEAGTPIHHKDRQHIDKIWARFESCRSGKAIGPEYGLPMKNPFQNWNTSDRYAHQSSFNPAGVQPHRAGALAVSQLIKKAQREGLLV